MNILTVGDKGKAGCHTCKAFVSITFKLRDVPLRDGSGIIDNVLAGVCDYCDNVVSLPLQPAPYLDTIQDAVKLQAKQLLEQSHFDPAEMHDRIRFLILPKTIEEKPMTNSIDLDTLNETLNKLKMIEEMESRYHDLLNRRSYFDQSLPQPSLTGKEMENLKNLRQANAAIIADLFEDVEAVDEVSTEEVKSYSSMRDALKYANLTAAIKSTVVEKEEDLRQDTKPTPPPKLLTTAVDTTIDLFATAVDTTIDLFVYCGLITSYSNEWSIVDKLNALAAVFNRSKEEKSPIEAASHISETEEQEIQAAVRHRKEV